MRDALKPMTRRKTTDAFGPTHVARNHRRAFAIQIATSPVRRANGMRT